MRVDAGYSSPALSFHFHYRFAFDFLYQFLLLFLLLLLGTSMFRWIHHHWTVPARLKSMKFVSFFIVLFDWNDYSEVDSFDFNWTSVSGRNGEEDAMIIMSNAYVFLRKWDQWALEFRLPEMRDSRSQFHSNFFFFNSFQVNSISYQVFSTSILLKFVFESIH